MWWTTFCRIMWILCCLHSDLVSKVHSWNIPSKGFIVNAASKSCSVSLVPLSTISSVSSLLVGAWFFHHHQTNLEIHIFSLYIHWWFTLLKILYVRSYRKKIKFNMTLRTLIRNLYISTNLYQHFLCHYKRLPFVAYYLDMMNNFENQLMLIKKSYLIIL